MVGRPSIEAMAMAGADWTRYCADDDDGDECAPPEHLRAFDAFLETVVPADMALAFSRDEARHGGRRRTHRENVEEKLKLWAKAVAREAKVGVLGSQPQQQATSRHRGQAREPSVILARPPPASPNSLARGCDKEKGAQTTSPRQAPVGKLGLQKNALLASSPRSGRRGEPCQSNQPLPKQDIKCIYGV